ncbi:universal stress protein [bacterium]|nr:universal stress protein [bacterium]
MYQKILVPLDGSAPSELAVAVALKLLAGAEAELLLSRMQDLGHELGYPMGFPVATETLEAEHLRCDTYLMTVAGRLAPDHPNIRRSVLPHQEEVAAALAQLAGQEASQLIVMTSHGWEGLDRTIRGSVAEQLARIAPCPVLIIGPHSDVMRAMKHPPLQA